MVSIRISLKTNGVEHFLYIYLPSTYLLWWSVYSNLCPLFFSYYRFKEFLICSSPLLDMGVEKPPSLGLPFSSSSSIFRKPEVLNFDEVQLHLFFLWIVLLLSYRRNIYLVLIHKDFLLIFLLKFLPVGVWFILN